MNTEAAGGMAETRVVGDGGNDVPLETPSPSDEKVGKLWKEKKKSRFSSKKSRKKKKAGKDLSPDSVDHSENDAAGADENPRPSGMSQKTLEREAQPFQRTPRGETFKRKDEESERELEQSGGEHSMQRARSTSRNRLSSLFRRKKRSRSETDISTKGSQEGQTQNETSERENDDGSKRRHESMEDMTRKMAEDLPNLTTSPPLKSSLKPTPVYYAFDPKTNPRDRLHHMTLRDVAREQRARRPRSLPRQRRKPVHMALEGQSGRTMSSTQLSEFATSPEDIREARSSTLPRSYKNLSSPVSGSGLSTPVYPSEVDVHAESIRTGLKPDFSKARSLSPAYTPSSPHLKMTAALPRNADVAGVATDRTYGKSDISDKERRTLSCKGKSESARSKGIEFSPKTNERANLESPPKTKSGVHEQNPNTVNVLKEHVNDYTTERQQADIKSDIQVSSTSHPLVEAHQQDKEDSKNRRKASLTKFLALSQRFPSSMSPSRRQSDANERDVGENSHESNTTPQDPVSKTSAKRDSEGNRSIKDTYSLPKQPITSQPVIGDKNQSGKSRIQDYALQSPPPLPMPPTQKHLNIDNETKHQKAQNKMPVEEKLDKPEVSSILSAPTSTPVSNPRFSLNDNELSTGDMIDLSSASMTSSINPDVEEERSSISSGPPVTSMTSSYRSSDQGYVDGDSEDGSDDDENSAFSTPPEDQETQKAREILSPVILRRLLQKASSGDKFTELDPNGWDRQSDKNMNLDSPPGFHFGRDRLSVRQGKPKTRGVQRSKSDVDRRKYVSPRTFGKDRPLFDDVNAFHTPPTSTERLTAGHQFVPMSAYAGISDEGDRASLTSTVTLTSLEGTSQHVSADPSKCDQKAYPVMGTAAQQKHRRTFSPARTRKLFPQVDESSGDTSPSVVKSILSRDLEDIPPTSSSFPLIPTPGSTSSIVYHIQQTTPPLQQFQDQMNAERSVALSSVPIPAKGDKSKEDFEVNAFPPDNVFPPLLITGLEISRDQPVSPGSKSLVECLQNQSAFNWKKRQCKDADSELSGLPLRRSFRTKDEGQTFKAQEHVEVKETLSSAKIMEDKECQTSSWLLNDLLDCWKSPTPKKKSNIFSNKKKKRHMVDVASNLSPLKIPKEKEALQRSSYEVTPSEDFSNSGGPTPIVSQGREGSAFKAVTSTPRSSEGKSPITPDLDSLVTAPTSLSDSEKQSPLEKSPGSESFNTPSSGTSLPPVSADIQAASKDADNSDQTSPKPKRLSFAAIILLKNRLAKFRDRKNREKEEAALPVTTEKIEADPPSDTFVSIENEINLSKLEISKETDIIDDDDIFEPEFSLDYPTKQLRFDPVTAGEPIQGEEPLPPLPPASSRRLRQRRESTMRERRKKCLSYCKKFVAFLFSHIGLCSLVVAYTIMGGFIFQALEAPAESSMKVGIRDRRNQVLDQIISMAVRYRPSEEALHNLTWQVNSTLISWQQDIHSATKEQGWDGTEKMGDEGAWTFASSLLYAITVTTTIGYGHVAPKTPEGRLVTIGYAVVGIPLTLLCLTNIGDVMATGFRLLYGKVCCGICCTLLKFKKRRIPPDLEKGVGRAMVTTEEEESDKPKEVIHVPTSLCLLLIAAYIFAGAMLFSMWEKWGILKGSYFCFITLSTIGFGDIVPGMDSTAWSHEEKLVLCALYLVFGLSLIAMCFNLVQEDVKAKCRWLGEKLGIVEKPETPM